MHTITKRRSLWNITHTVTVVDLPMGAKMHWDNHYRLDLVHFYFGVTPNFSTQMAVTNPGKSVLALRGNGFTHHIEMGTVP